MASNTPGVIPNMSDYDAERQSFRWEVPDEYNFAVDTIGQWAEDPNHLGMLHVDEQGHERRLTFAGFDRRSNRLASGLRELGVGPGDRVMLVLPRVPEWWEAILAIMKVGAISLPGTTLLMPRDLEYRAQASGATAIICDDEVAGRVDQVAGSCPDLTIKIIVGAEREGWREYESLLDE